jgi:hypothetical protein
VPCHRPGGPAATLVDVVYPATDAFNDPIKKICRKAAVAAVDHNRPVRVNGELGKMVRRTPSNRPLSPAGRRWPLARESASVAARGRRTLPRPRRVALLSWLPHSPAAMSCSQVGVGYHRGMRGIVEKYMVEKVTGKRADRKDQEAAVDSTAFEATKMILGLFRGRGAGVEEYEDDPLTPRTRKGDQVAPAGAASADLGNSSHYDVNDMSRGWCAARRRTAPSLLLAGVGHWRAKARR